MSRPNHNRYKSLQKLDPNVRLLLGPREVRLSCGCITSKPPQISNPDRWWHCGGWQHRLRLKPQVASKP